MKSQYNFASGKRGPVVKTPAGKTAHHDSLGRTTALYGHMTRDGVAVSVGASVEAGQVIAASGNTGNTANRPHLHFSLQSCDPVSGGTSGCPTLPVSFRNTDPNPDGLQAGRVYQARVH